MWPQVVFKSSEYSSIFISLDKKREIIIFQRKNMYQEGLASELSSQSAKREISKTR